LKIIFVSTCLFPIFIGRLFQKKDHIVNVALEFLVERVMKTHFYPGKALVAAQKKNK
jgi:hypothetical protein